MIFCKSISSRASLSAQVTQNERVSTQKLTLFLYFKGFERRDGGFVTRSWEVWRTSSHPSLSAKNDQITRELAQESWLFFYFIVITWSVPLHDTLTPVGREENVALFPEYLIVTVVVNVAFSTKSSGPDSRKSFLETRVLFNVIKWLYLRTHIGILWIKY